MSNSGRQNGAGTSTLYKSELKLQKKGIKNMTIEELQQWIQICDRNQENVSHNKARRSWKESKAEAEKQLEKLLRK